MCGRAYSTYTDEELELRYQATRPIHLRLSPDYVPHYNLAPSLLLPVIRTRDGTPRIELSRWGFVAYRPRPGERPGIAPINAKSETVHEKSMFKSSVMNRRCIVPVTGFYEWKRTSDGKQPYAIHGTQEKILSFAGIYNEVLLPSGEVLDTFAVLTTSANGVMKQIHDRMPVLLDREEEKLWLAPDTEWEKLEPLLRPCADGVLTTYPVSTAVNSPRNNSIQLLDRVEVPDGPAQLGLKFTDE